MFSLMVYPIQKAVGREEWILGLAWYVLLLLAWLVLSPGLTGGFSFDDIPNLAPLSNIYEPSLYFILQFTLDGVSSQIGRPLSLLTFAVQHGDWPCCADGFLRFNLLLHLLNGCLLFWGLLRLLRLAQRAESEWARFPCITALLAAGLWLFAPAHITTVLYAVQRMALMATTCVFAGFLLHVTGRAYLAQGQLSRGWLLIAAGLFVGAGLGVLSKENAALYPLMILVMEATLLRVLERPPSWRLGAGLLLGLPAALLLTYLLIQIPGLPEQYGHRAFTAAERLMTQARVLFTYLGDLLFPSLYSGTRLLYDDYVISRSLIEPWVTAVAVAAWLALVPLAWRIRAKQPVFAFALFWYLAGHLLESTFLPLEIAFSHRNYLPSVGIFLGLATLVVAAHRAVRTQRLRPIIQIATLAYIVFFVTALWLSAALWGQPLERISYWARSQPESRRALMEWAATQARHGAITEAEKTYRHATQHWPRDAAIQIAWAGIACETPGMRGPDLAEIKTVLLNSDAPVVTTMVMLQQLVESVAQGLCTRLSPPEVTRVVESGAANSIYSPGWAATLLAKLSETAGNREEALRLMDDMVFRDANVSYLQYAVITALQLDDVARARRYLASAEPGGPYGMIRRWIYRKEIRELRKLVENHSPSPGKIVPSKISNQP